MSAAPEPGLVLRRVDAADAPRLAAARQILREYASSLVIDLRFQNFEAELQGLPGDYAAPSGLLLLAEVDAAVAGCGAIRALPDCDLPNACELKRLYVRPAFRRDGLGRILAQALLEAARVAGYKHVLLDTLSSMEAARELYRSLGFVETPPYYYNPIPGTHYLRAEFEAAPKPR